MIVLDSGFYALLMRKRGIAGIAVGVPLHVVHRLTSAVAVPFAVAAHVLDTDGRRA
jgi:hypothetical protein